MRSKLLAVAKAKGMVWPQIYDGKVWQTDLAVQFGVKGIPHPYLVDGDTGLIIAQGSDIMGEKLGTVIEKSLAAKKNRSN